MNLIEKINGIYESSRILLLNTEPISKNIEKISPDRVKERLLKVFRTAQADLLIFNDLLIGIMDCESEEDIALFLQQFEDEN